MVFMGNPVVLAGGIIVCLWAARLYAERQQASRELLSSLAILILLVSPGQFFRSLAAGLTGWLLADFSSFFLSGCYPSSSSTAWASPMVYPARTHHARFFPEKHAFSYSYLLVGVPVERGRIFRNRMLALDCDHSTRSWLDVRSDDHLLRTRGADCMRDKLDEYLESEKIEPSLYPFAYLVTAPRFLGYCFNPVSFWYLYCTEKKLSALILEVNNTFDERRMYFLEPSKLVELEGDTNGHLSFEQEWPKDFHVSPFNDRTGTYTLLARDPLRVHPSKDRLRTPLSNTIKLWTTDNKLKLVARVFETSAPQDATLMTLFDRLRCLGSWWWTGFFTYPRIVREAGSLYFKRCLPVWYRPEVKNGSIGRDATLSEIKLEESFRDYLRHVVRICKKPLHLTYIRPTPLSGQLQSVREEIFLSASADKEEPQQIIFRPLTPYFYAHFSHYGSSIEAILSCTLLAAPENALLHVSDPELIPLLFDASRRKENQRLTAEIEDNAWQNLQDLRQHAPRPPPQAYPTTHSYPSNASDIRRLPLSDLDCFVRSHYSEADALEYRKAVVQSLERSMWGINLWTVGRIFCLAGRGVLILSSAYALKSFVTLNWDYRAI